MTTATNASPCRPLQLGAMGGAAGCIGAFMGGGGGILLVPYLDSRSTMSRAEVSGTASLANACIAVAGFCVHGFWRATVVWWLLGALAVGATAGAIFGGRLSLRIPEWPLRVALIVVVVTVIYRMAAAPAVLAAHAAEQIPSWPTAMLALAAGLAIGAWSSLMGMGGGLLAVPALTQIFGLPLPAALGTSMALMLPTALASAATHATQGTARLCQGAWLGGGAALATLGSTAIVTSIPVQWAAVVYATLLSAIGVREAAALLAWRRRTPPGSGRRRGS